MIEKLRTLGILPRDMDEEEAADEEVVEPFPMLRFLTAQLLLTTGIESARDALHKSDHTVDEHPDYDRRTRLDTSYTTRWGPLILGSAAAAAQVVHALRPSAATRAATRVLNAGVIGVGVVSMAQSRSPAPLALETAAVLGLLLERQEERSHEERQQLRKRADIVERFVPRRRSKLDRIVVHV